LRASPYRQNWRWHLFKYVLQFPRELEVTLMKATRILIQIWLLCAVILPAVVQAQFTFTTNNGTISITGYTGTNEDATIPRTTNGLPVTSIVSCKFGPSSGVTNVTIPDSVTNIGFGAFEYFNYPAGVPPDTFLSAITVDTNNSVYSSVDRVLLDKIHGTLIQYPCGKAESNYTIPNSVTNIANDAFYYCINLASVTISGSVTNIGAGAFVWCFGLTNATIGNGVTSIGASAFIGTSLTSVTIGTNVTSIGASAFSGTRLTSITIPNSVTSIGTGAFNGCPSLTSVTIGTNVTSIGNNAFENCSSLANLTIPNSVTNIGFQLFFGCRGLTHVTIGNNVTSIGTEAFDACSSLTNLTIPSSVTSIGDDPFVGCSSLTGIYFLGNAPSVGIIHGVNECNAIVYYLPGTKGWGAVFASLVTGLWLPQVQTRDATFGGQTNQFGFNINWASDRIVVVEACTDLSNPVWTLVGTNTLTGGSSHFSDSQWTNYPNRFYRLRSP
jgi:hypothetical protein